MKLGLSKMACTVFVFCVATAIAVSAQTFTTLHSFDGTDGANPSAGVVQGADGNLYGTASEGGGGYGTIFKITPTGTLTTLHSFDGTDGERPYAGLIQATDGNFYGATDAGGGGEGTIFKITATGTLTTLYSFDGTDGVYPHGSYPSGLIQAAGGNFFGTSDEGGSNGGGTIFKITPTGTLTTLYSFGCVNGYCTDGASPHTALIQATDGDFYGTTSAGGLTKDFGEGTIFKISSTGTLTRLHSFDGTDGEIPDAGLMQATDGSFYGMTFGGGVHGRGTIFKITPTGTLTTLHSFDGTDGFSPQAELVQATDGNFYGQLLTEAGAAVPAQSSRSAQQAR
ncbi:MAG: choice-of-anchor tandem repeat GloVer-containing protein [Candidatus Sulfotelmatobacter sp.]